MHPERAYDGDEPRWAFASQPKEILDHLSLGRGQARAQEQDEGPDLSTAEDRSKIGGR
jgi:hypothetical protein